MPVISKSPRYHNFITHSRDISYSSKDKGVTGTISGIDAAGDTPMEVGDYILLPGKSTNGLSRYRITAIHYRYAPKGAYTGNVEYCDWSDAAWDVEYLLTFLCLNSGTATWEVPT